MEEKSYFAWPLRRVQIQRHPGSLEIPILLVSAIADLVLRTAAAFFERFLEKEFDDCGLAYRRVGPRGWQWSGFTLYEHGYMWLRRSPIGKTSLAKKRSEDLRLMTSESGPGLLADQHSAFTTPSPVAAQCRGLVHARLTVADYLVKSCASKSRSSGSFVRIPQREESVGEPKVRLSRY